MATDFAVALHRFLTSHLAGLRGCSPNTVASYRDTFKLLIAWFRDNRSVPPDKLTLDRIDTAAITGFLDWLETERHNSISTRNQRLAAVSSFFRWLETERHNSISTRNQRLAAVSSFFRWLQSETQSGWSPARTSSPSPRNARRNRA